ncbi:MAG: fructosamine kinase family protein [Methylococcales bacterium]|jgi:protein-ribulosamine 3-kinase|nr:fructosamine kinase family protein [Methylococcales bacterium]MBT7444687.1 fructosamine kinase family protein [Methylococcales bacterium]
MQNWISIAEHIQELTGDQVKIDQLQGLSGGCINDSYRLSSDNKDYFVKLNQPNLLTMFEAEADGLTALANSNAIRVPEAICSGVTHQQSYLVLEYIPLTSNGDQRTLGLALAQLHQNTAEQFGWFRDNVIGATHQPNQQTTDWLTFYANQRLQFQFDLAHSNGARLKKGNQLIELLPKFFTEQPEASLLHGDLWGGNMAFDDNDNPVLFDPAVYYGDREADIAMTELFGGFTADFYAAYNEVYPLEGGYQVRKKLYNLYHVVNHFNLFGGGYLSQAEHIIDELITSVT